MKWITKTDKDFRGGESQLFVSSNKNETQFKAQLVAISSGEKSVGFTLAETEFSKDVFVKKDMLELKIFSKDSFVLSISLLTDKNKYQHDQKIDKQNSLYRIPLSSLILSYRGKNFNERLTDLDEVLKIEVGVLVSRQQPPFEKGERRTYEWDLHF